MDIILYNIIACLLAFLIGYFIGSIPTGVIIGKVFFKKDPRKFGSGSSGGTNMSRLFGKKVGFTVIFLDAIKAIVAMTVVWAIVKFSGLSQAFAAAGGELFRQGATCIYLAPLGAIIGHCWPIFAGFKGGKAVACVAGFALCSCWLSFVIGLIIFIIVLKKSKFVSLGSMLCTGAGAIVCWILYIFFATGVMPISIANIFMVGGGNYVPFCLELCISLTLGVLILFIRHRANIKRLKNNKENVSDWVK